MDPGDADREELAERVEQLEQTVSKMLPDRRGVLKGLGAAAVGGAVVGGATGGASGQSGAAGSQGTPENPNDMYAWDLDVQNGADFNGTDIEDAGSLSTEELHFGDGDPNDLLPEKRPLTNSEDRTVTVPGDYDTIQDAIDSHPIFPRFDTEIRVDSSQTWDEDLFIGPIISDGPGDLSEAQGPKLQIRPDGVGEDGPIEINSVSAYRVLGSNALDLAHIRVTDDADSNESVGMFFNGCKTVRVTSPRFGSGCTNGLLAYSADVMVNSVGGEAIDIGTDNVDMAFMVKNGGNIYQKATGSDAVGTATTGVYDVNQGGSIHFRETDMEGGGSLVRGITGGGGFAYDMSNAVAYLDGVRSPLGGFTIETSTSSDGSAPSEGVRLYFYTGATDNELRAVDEAGKVQTVATFD